jgi:hypothetical protein
MAEAESSNESPAAAVGFGPNAGGTFSQEDYHHPAAGWGAAISVTEVLLKQGEILDGTRAVLKMNHENGGFDCPGCAWPDDHDGLHAGTQCPLRDRRLQFAERSAFDEARSSRSDTS